MGSIGLKIDEFTPNGLRYNLDFYRGLNLSTHWVSKFIYLMEPLLDFLAWATQLI